MKTTLKVKYDSDVEFQTHLKAMRREQSSVVRFSFNRFQEGFNQKEIRAMIKDLNNINLLDAWWIQSAITTAETLFSAKKDAKVIFGGSSNLKRYTKGLISKTEWKECRLMPLTCYGDAPSFGNRKFRLDVTNNQIFFQDKRGKIKHTLSLKPQLRDRLEQLFFIEDQAKNKRRPLFVKITQDYIHLTFSPKQQQTVASIPNRILAIDTNPNSIGWSVCDIINEEPNVVESGIVDLTKLNKQKTTKKHFEIFQISKFLVDKANHYKCGSFAVEDLSVVAKDHAKGKTFNKIVNNDWIRTKLIYSIEKRCFISNIKFIAVNPAYTSVIGGTLHRKYPDPIAPTLEIARRAYFKYQKGYFYPKTPNVETLNELWKQTLEKSLNSWVEVSSWLKNTKLRYRVPLDSCDSRVFRLKSRKSAVECRSLYI
jgi:IS605 OrfB family transposase